MANSKKEIWFPKCREDLDKTSNNIVEFGDDLAEDHPGFNDKIYRERRLMIGKIAHNYKCGHKIPEVDYLDRENDTWKFCLTNLMNFFQTHACQDYNDSLKILIENNVYERDKIPQLQKVSEFMEERTGWAIRPVKGLLSTRDFLAALAYKVFYTTQYIRHHSKPFYTPEPDIIHELVGHIPLLLNKEFSDFSQKLGELSLGLPDEKVEELGRLYWYSIEFGLINEQIDNNVVRKVYGAGILSSVDEMRRSLSDELRHTHVPFDPKVLAKKDYPITKFQDIYAYIDSFDQIITLIENYIKG